jgi:cytochrome c-type biogenesis protein CcmF
VLDVSKGGKHVTTLTTTRSFYPAPNDPTLGPISDSFNGQADSQVGLRAGLTRDIWTVINPDLTPLQPLINLGDRKFTQLMTSLTPAEARNPKTIQFIEIERARAIVGLTQRFITHPWGVNFLLIVSPLVTWIWLGALIIAIGAVIALWPVPPRVAPKRAVARSPARAPPAPPVAVREPV